ncbi:MAG: glutamine amidotransferase [Tessaracoccus sp.]|uniref:glutamine amidotransferase n=2 Tax=Tessaracoccus sp. TaxID=1971211 RepID=UPI001EBD5660|nr:glutamine amidotransferase [Tessaracoccus sp.]MBK7821364.1 glutamine amidotransferase [Tessaracoccus sp.]
MTRPFLLLSTRPEDDAVAGEREAILSKAGLEEAELVQHRVERFPLPELNLDDFSGVLLGGGPFNASDEDKSELQLRVEADIAQVVVQAVEREVPLLGLCYGIGALTSTLGGVVDRTYGEPVGVVDVTLTEEGRDDPLFDGIPTIMRAFVGHKEACRELPPGATLLATGEACPVQAYRVGPWAYATQFHPDLDPRGMAERILIYREAGYFAPDETEELSAFALDADITDEVHAILSNFVRLARQSR